MGDLPGSTEATNLLQKLSDISKSGEFDYAVVILHSAKNEIVGGYAGNSMVEPQILTAMDEGKASIEKSIKDKELPPRDETLDSSHVCYNLLYAPCSYDFTTWLVAQEVKRKRDNAPAPLKVYFHGEDDPSSLADPNRSQMFHNVMRPAVKLLGAIESEEAKLGHFEPYFGPRPLIEAARQGEKIPSFKASPQAEQQVAHALRDTKPVTITLREAAQWSFRNSNINEWLKFANWLQQQGETVVIVRDTLKAAEPLTGFNTYPMASIDLDIRTALYNQAKANCFVSNGPGIIAFCGDKPFLMVMQMLKDGHLYHPQTAKYWDDHVGIKEGEQYPWCRPDQRLIWGQDNFDTLVQSWKEINGQEKEQKQEVLQA